MRPARRCSGGGASTAWPRPRAARLGELGAHATETIQGLAELMAFEATTRRRDEFMAYARRYQAMRLALLHDLTRQTAGLEVATGLGGLAVAAVGAPLVLHGWIAPTMLPLLVLISIAAFLPVSEIAQVGRQLADTIASTRRLHVVHAEPVVITDGPRVPAAPRGGSTVRVRACALHLSRPAAPGAGGCRFRRAGRRDGGAGRAVRRRQDHDRQSAAALLGPASRARSGWTASICAS